MKICMLVKNSFEYDARVTKEARSLIAAGHEVTVVAIHVPGTTAQHEVRADGIEVIRVSRMHFGLGTLNRIASRYAGTIEERHSRLTGEPVDEDRVREMGTFHQASTATPGDAQTYEAPRPTRSSDEQEPSDGSAPGSLRRAWATSSTSMLRWVAAAARFAFKVVKALMGRQGRALKTWAINRRFVEAALSTRPDVVHAHDLNTLYVATRVKQRTGAKLVYDSHELATGRNRMGFWWRVWSSYWERRGVPHADEIIMASPGYAEVAVERYGIEMPTVILNVPPPQPIDRSKDLRAALEIPDGQRIAIYQGSIQENRGIEQTIDAVLQVEGLGLVVVGYGYHRPALERMVRERGIGDKVRFFGPVPNPELVSWSASADVGMCNIIDSSPSYRHSLPNKLFEYLMAGIPVVASGFSHMGRIIREFEVGETCDPSDPDALAAALARIVHDPEREQRYRQNTAQASARYNWEREEQDLIGLYERLAGRQDLRTAS